MTSAIRYSGRRNKLGGPQGGFPTRLAGRGRKGGDSPPCLVLLIELVTALAHTRLRAYVLIRAYIRAGKRRQPFTRTRTRRKRQTGKNNLKIPLTLLTRLGIMTVHGGE